MAPRDLGQISGGRISDGAVRQVFRVNYGYRALLDWSRASISQRGRSGLTGPHPFGSKADANQMSGTGFKPAERQGSNTKIPGSMGIYWDIAGAGGGSKGQSMSVARVMAGEAGKWQSAKGPKGGMGGGTRANSPENVRAVLDTLGAYPQQWLYLAAEAMNLEAPPPPINWTDFALSASMELAWGEKRSDPAWKKGLGMAAGKADPSDDDDRFLKEQMLAEVMGYVPAENVAGTNIQTGLSRTHSYSDEIAQAIAMDMEYESTGPGANLRDEVTAANEGFTRLMTKLGLSSSKSWIGAFVGEVSKQARSRIKELEKEFEKYLKRKRGTIGQNAKTALGPGAAVLVNEDPQSVEEHAGVSQGTQGGGFTITAPQIPEFGPTFSIDPEKYSYRNYGNPIDLKFEEEVQINGGPVFKRMDITKSFLLDAKGNPTGTHGTGSAEYTFEGVTSKKEVEDRIRTGQRAQLVELNRIMALVLNWAQQQGAQTTDLGPRGGRTTGPVNWQRIRNLVQKDTKAALKTYIGSHLNKDFDWIMHHIANMMPGQADNYANVMSIIINNSHGTLVLVYDIDQTTGYYRDVFVDIFEDQTPLEWISTVAQELGAAGTLDEIAQNANVGQAALGLSNVKQFGVLYQAVEMAAGNAIHPRFSMGKIIEPAFSQGLDRLMQHVFLELSADLQKGVSASIKKNAVTYSKQARRYSSGHNIRQWYAFAVSFLRSSQGDQPYQSLSGDDFWFLWTAPYVSSEYHQEGMAKQYAGAEQRASSGSGGISY